MRPCPWANVSAFIALSLLLTSSYVHTQPVLSYLIQAHTPAASNISETSTASSSLSQQPPQQPPRQPSRQPPKQPPQPPPSRGAPRRSASYFVDKYLLWRFNQRFIQPLLVSWWNFANTIKECYEIKGTLNEKGNILMSFFQSLYGLDRHNVKMGVFARFWARRVSFSAYTRDMLRQMRYWAQYVRSMRQIELADINPPLSAPSFPDMGGRTTPFPWLFPMLDTLVPYKHLLYHRDLYRSFNHTFTLIHRTANAFIDLSRYNGSDIPDDLRKQITNSEWFPFLLNQSFEKTLNHYILKEITEGTKKYCRLKSIKEDLCIALLGKVRSKITEMNALGWKATVDHHITVIISQFNENPDPPPQENSRFNKFLASVTSLIPGLTKVNNEFMSE
ncbi:MAG: hypothetical protein DHS80DRAFT_24561 [Piptocephalis tieghemiana]|nr:MAG: hypothetical protein DHS80DRAFT_24561 [Piptocephalis tieghemiana]